MIVGLGNPGPPYANTRHNVGFMVVDEIAQRLGVDAWKNKERAKVAHVRTHELILVKPQSFMNDSGVPTRLVATYHRVPAERMLVVYDDLDLPFGRIRMRESGSSGGHNGMKSVIKYFGVDVPRLRIGIGRSSEDDAIARVLGGFSAAERDALAQIVGAGADAAMRWLEHGFALAANVANAWRLPA